MKIPFRYFMLLALLAFMIVTCQKSQASHASNVVRDYFEALVSSDGMPGKPDPMVFLEAARSLGVPPQSCVVVEDGLPGLQAARGAGMRCIAVTTTHPASALLLADRVVESLEDLPDDGFDVFPETGLGTQEN